MYTVAMTDHKMPALQEMPVSPVSSANMAAYSEIFFSYAFHSPILLKLYNKIIYYTLSTYAITDTKEIQLTNY